MSLREYFPGLLEAMSEETKMEPMDQEYLEADRELQELGFKALDRCYESGADKDSLQYLAWMAGLGDWKPHAQRRAA